MSIRSNYFIFLLSLSLHIIDRFLFIIPLLLQPFKLVSPKSLEIPLNLTLFGFTQANPDKISRLLTCTLRIFFALFFYI